MSAWQLLPSIRDLYRRLPEAYHLQPWEPQHVFYSLGYSDDPADEAGITAAVEVACQDWAQWRAA